MRNAGVDPKGSAVGKSKFATSHAVTVTVGIAFISNFRLRFPGQYYDEKTKLIYNWRRYYNLETDDDGRSVDLEKSLSVSKNKV